MGKKFLDKNIIGEGLVNSPTRVGVAYRINLEDGSFADVSKGREGLHFIRYVYIEGKFTPYNQGAIFGPELRDKILEAFGYGD